MKRSVLIFAFVVFSFAALASLPPVESLLRNGSNREISTNTIALTFKVSQLKSLDENTLKAVEVSETQEKKSIIGTDEDEFEAYYKIYFFANNGRYHIVQGVYENSDTKDGKPFDFYTKRNFYTQFTGNEAETLDREVFYGALGSLVLNESSGLGNLLRKKSPRFKSNQEVMNGEKFSLLKRYKKYLEDIRKDPSLENVLVSPLKPEDEEEQKKVDEVLKNEMYNSGDLVKLVKDRSKFFLNVDLGNFTMRYSEDNHHLLEFKSLIGANPIELKFENYILFNGAHHLPKYLSFKDSLGKLYLVQMIQLQHFNSSDNFYRRKVGEFKKSATRKVEYNKPKFLF